MPIFYKLSKNYYILGLFFFKKIENSTLNRYIVFVEK